MTKRRMLSQMIFKFAYIQIKAAPLGQPFILLEIRFELQCVNVQSE